MPHHEGVSPLILVVDDNADLREMCALTLRLVGFRTEEAENGAIAFEKAITLTPDAILLDDAMPVMDGRETARRLRADARTQETPLVLLTGFATTSTRGRELRAEADCDAYVQKPCGPDELVASLRAALLLRAAPCAAPLCDLPSVTV
jgi:two-component system cell cycle response regulator DivK